MNYLDFLGYGTMHPADYVYISPNDDCYLLLLTRTPAEFFINGSFHEYPANSAILFPPRHTAHYRACCGEYRDDWIRFRSDEPFVLQFPKQGVPFPVSDMEYCHNLIMLLTWESALTSSSSELIISNLLFVLFSKLREDAVNQTVSPHTDALQNLRKQIYNKPQKDWNVSLMAEQLHISAGYLQSLYKKMFNISCMDDVIEGRIRLAKEQLIYTTHTIQAISELCGYQNVEHFCRQFRKKTGLTPLQFRKRALSCSSDARFTGHTDVFKNQKE